MEGIEPVPASSFPEVAVGKGLERAYEGLHPEVEEAKEISGHNQSAIYSNPLTRKHQLFIALLLSIIIIAAVGGGLGGGLKHRTRFSSCNLMWNSQH